MFPTQPVSTHNQACKHVQVLRDSFLSEKHLESKIKKPGFVLTPYSSLVGQNAPKVLWSLCIDNREAGSGLSGGWPGCSLEPLFAVAPYPIFLLPQKCSFLRNWAWIPFHTLPWPFYSTNLQFFVSQIEFHYFREFFWVLDLVLILLAIFIAYFLSLQLSSVWIAISGNLANISLYL